MSSPRWQFWIDRGGTFTDCLGRDPRDGSIHVVKVLSSDRAPLVGIRRLLGLSDQAPIPPCDVRMGTTLATNALLEKKGARTALVITRGFGDLLAIGTQARPELFQLAIRKPEQLEERVLEVAARLDPRGNVLETPDTSSTRAALAALRGAGLESAAVVVLHAYRDGRLEQELGAWARDAGFEYVACSHEVAPELGLHARAGTTVLDAYLTPRLSAYVAALAAELPGSTLELMQSSGRLTSAERFRGPNAIFSGPAGGVVAYARVAERLGVTAIGFDMGGTSTDVSRYAGSFERVYETDIAGLRVAAPALCVHSVASGGGSLCRFDGARFSVGPESAGARPGPLCYGDPAAEEPTLTDVNLLLGRLRPERFPFELDRSRAERGLAELGGRAAAAGKSLPLLELCQGLFEIANVNMAEAIRQVSVARGHDLREHTLFVFGGAGGQHACALARRLGIRDVVFHAFGGVMSAYGMGLADQGWLGHADAGRVALAPEALAGLTPTFEALLAQGRAVLGEHGELEIDRRVRLRYADTETALELELAPAEALRAAFHELYRTSFGYARPEHRIEIVEARVELVRRAPELEPGPAGGRATEARRTGSLFLDGRMLHDVPIVWREALATGSVERGPLLVVDQNSTIVVEPDFELSVPEPELLRLRWLETAELGAPPARASSSGPDPIALEVMANQFMSIAEQMGQLLRRTAISTNIRERLDYSCAVFDRTGGLVANAPHIPVHLGAMGESVRAVLAAFPEPAPGDMFVTNDPARGGSHLPDITVVAPVHDRAGRLSFFAASRGHHADVGGITPGSMPPFSRTLAEEGVVLGAERLIGAGRLEREHLLSLLGSGPYPARNPLGNLADLEAQAAACHLGAELLRELVAGYGQDHVSEYMQHVQDEAAAKVEHSLRSLGGGERRFADTLDDGTPIQVRLKLRDGRLTIDFTGTGSEHDGNLNAPRAVTIAAVIYCLRSLVAARIPLNAGCLRPVTLTIPPRCLLDPGPERAVAGGNVETSQRIVDVLLGAFGSAAASQGSMNNLSFGNQEFGYYETIAGGAGAGPGFPGASAVHTHMTNTRITDPEVLESRYPVRLLEFSIRRGSGGAGEFAGGDGVIREFQFLAALSVAILSERRTTRPFGLAGGAPGAPGRNLLNGRDLGAKFALSVQAGDRLRIETPGGGGYGAYLGRKVET